MFRETVKGFINLSFALVLVFQSQADVQHISSRFIGYAKIFYGIHCTHILLGVLVCCIAFYKLCCIDNQRVNIQRYHTAKLTSNKRFIIIKVGSFSVLINSKELLGKTATRWACAWENLFFFTAGITSKPDHQTGFIQHKLVIVWISRPIDSYSLRALFEQY